MKKDKDEMLAEYDLSGRKGVRGKYAKSYKAGHSVRKLVSDQYFAAIESDVREYFPDSEAVNSALRKLIAIIPRNA